MLRLLVITSLFLFPAFQVYGSNIDTTKYKSTDREAKINALYDSIVASNRYVEKLDSSTFFNLPVGFTGGADKDNIIYQNFATNLF